VPAEKHAAALAFEPALPAPESASPLAFEPIFERYAGYVLGLLHRLGVGDAEVDDVAQEVFLAIHHNLHAFEQRSSLKTWICGICLRQARNARRVASRRSAHLTPLFSEPAVAHDAERQLEQAEHAALFAQGLAQLSLAQRAVFVLYEVEELSIAEIAETVGCPRFTAYTRLHSARRKLRAFFERARAQGRFS
jgi:RNA polymerase sigma-70 factor, ECF subfamily